MRTLYASVDDHLLSELPRFFGSLEVALSEIFQNAYRAGAQLVTLTWEPDANSVAFTDDGPGLADPEILLTAGRSGWNHDVIDPAGVGAFAALQYSESITYTSRGAGNWRMVVTADALRRCPVTVEDIPAGGTPGLAVQLKFRAGIVLTEKMIRLARQFYPFRVTLHNLCAATEHTLLPPDELEPQLSLLTPAGQVEWSTARPRSEGLYEQQRGYGCEAVWEHKRFTSQALRNALRAVARTGSPLAKIVAERSIRWFADPASGVRPRLPDRSELLDDEYLKAAASQILDAVEAALLAEARVQSAFWPERLSSLTYRAHEFGIADLGCHWPNWLHDEQVMDAILPQLGWLKVAYESVRQLNTYDNGEEGLAVETESEKEFHRRALPLASRSLIFTLNHLGIPAAFIESAAPLSVTINSFRYHPACPHVALCAAIRVGGADLPFVLADLEHDGFDFAQADVSRLRRILNQVFRRRKRTMPYASPPMTPSVIFAGSAEDFVRYLREGEHRWTLLNLVALRYFRFGDAQLDGWVAYDRAEFDWDAIIRTLTLEVSRCFDTGMAAARAAYYALQDAQEQLWTLARSLDQIIENLKQAGDLTLGSTLQALRAFSAQVERHQELIRRRAQSLGSEARLLSLPQPAGEPAEIRIKQGGLTQVTNDR